MESSKKPARRRVAKKPVEKKKVWRYSPETGAMTLVEVDS